jgi:hypothetical protein
MTRSKSTNKNLNDAVFLKQVVGTYLQEYLDQEMSHHLKELNQIFSLMGVSHAVSHKSVSPIHHN